MMVQRLAFKVACLAGWTLVSTLAVAADARLRDVVYDAQAVVTVPVKRGVVTLIALNSDESISEVASGMGADCSKPDASWCIAAQPGGHTIFVKPKRAAAAANNLAVVTDQRSYAFRFVVLAEGDARSPVYRLQMKAPALLAADTARPRMAASGPTDPAAVADVLAERLSAAPAVVNGNYAVAEGAASSDIVPTLVFDDGRFTYLRFPANREVPAVFQVRADGSETLVNSRMEGDLLVVDRVSRHLVLRAGSAVIGVWNEAFDADGVPPRRGTTVVGVRRTLKPGRSPTTEEAMP